jgi:nucleolar protein 9
MMLSLDDLIALCHDATGSRIVDAMLESSTVPKQVKRKFIMSFIGNFHLLVDDRIGSRVGDRLWASADPYLKVQCFICSLLYVADVMFICF